jgi:hypothetical protein
MGGNIIDWMVTSQAGFSDEEIHTAVRDFIPGTDHRAIIAFINIMPPAQLADQRMIFMTHDVTHPRGTSLIIFEMLWTEWLMNRIWPINRS